MSQDVLSRRKFVRIGAIWMAAAADLAISRAERQSRRLPPVPDKLVVLTFDDAVKSHLTVVSPLLKELGFGATFFITHRWMADRENFLTWDEVAEIYRMGFEIGNHSWKHDNFSEPKNAARLAGQTFLVEYMLGRVGVPRPVSFAYPGNRFGPEAIKVLAGLGYKFARRGMQPEVEYGKIEVGPTFDPKRHHPLLIPTTGDAYPGWTLEHFQRVTSRARNGQIVVLQFHGVPDLKHPWVHTPIERFRQYMHHLKENGFKAIAMRDLERYTNPRTSPKDPLLDVRFPGPKAGNLELPVEVQATRSDVGYWLENMLRYHGYTIEEAAQVCGLSRQQVRKLARERRISLSPPPERKTILVLPYPGGRHPRIGFKDGAIDPLRGTKASVFLPWDLRAYVVVDLPEAIFSGKDLIFLAHTHIPTVWDELNITLDNVDWNREPDGSLQYSRALPNGIVFGARIRPLDVEAEMELWLRNETDKTLAGLRAQVCVLLKGASGFNAQTNDNKIFRGAVAAVRSAAGNRWILTAWQRCGRVWGNHLCPCMHSDPVLPDCIPGETVRVRGRLWFYQGDHIERELEGAQLANCCGKDLFAGVL